MNISSVLLRARPEKLPHVRAGLAAMPGVAIHADANDGRLVVIVEGGTDRAAADSFSDLHDLDGVIAVSLVYQFDDGLPEETEP